MRESLFQLAKSQGVKNKKMMIREPWGKNELNCQRGWPLREWLQWWDLEDLRSEPSQTCWIGNRKVKISQWVKSLSQCSILYIFNNPLLISFWQTVLELSIFKSPRILKYAKSRIPIEVTFLPLQVYLLCSAVCSKILATRKPFIGTGNR